MSIKVFMLLFALGLSLARPVHAFDHEHRLWDQLLDSHVHDQRDGLATVVDYRALRADPHGLDRYLASLSGVTRPTFDGWSPARQLAFLINAYNAFTVKLIVEQPANPDSIRDIGGLFGSPWSQRFFTLLGKRRTLDELEHEMIRPVYQEPRIHMAVNCASIGCPALARSAYTGSGLDAQLDRAVERFLSDSTRNRYKAVTRTFEVSSIFKWYGDDWNADTGYPDGVRGFLLDHLAPRSADGDAGPESAADADIDYLDYDWSLNSLQNATE